MFGLFVGNRLRDNIMPKFSFLLLAALAVILFDQCDCQRQPVFPCVDFQAIRWVRDATICDQYYVCHFGQPMSMPSCPRGQVWSNKALNCVPENSRWDDCNTASAGGAPIESLDQEKSYHTVGYDTKESTNLEQPPREDVVIFVKQLPTQETIVIQKSNPVVQAKTVYRNNPVAQNNLVKRLDTNQVQITTRRPSQVTIPLKLRPGLQRKEDASPTEKPEVRQSVRKYTPPTKAQRYTTTRPSTTARPATITATTRKHVTTTTTTTTRKSVITTRRPITTTPKPRTTTKFSPKVESRQSSRLKSRQETKLVPSVLDQKLNSLGVPADHPCLSQPNAFLPHPKNCHWYYNCSLSIDDEAEPEYVPEDRNQDTREGFYLLKPFRVRNAGAFVWECRFPQLFDDVTNTCREFVNVQCKSRFEPVEQCEYTARQQCRGESCVPCQDRFGRCRGRENGVYPVHEDKWTPLFVTCYLQRNIALDECIPPTPIFSPEAMDCVSLFEVPKEHGGFLPDCSHRPDGYFPDEQGRCAIFFRCSLGKFRGYDECPPGTVFDPAIPACQPFSLASKPCGEGQSPLCGGKLDGLYADPHGRCTHYFECKNGAFQQYNICDLGIFDPLSQKCVVSAELTVRPCGLQPSPCESLPTGVYPDQATGCHNFIECQRGVMLTNGTCAAGTVFSAVTGRCDLPEHAPPPCGFSNTCLNKPDGRYPALSRGCSFFYECYHEEFVSLRRCTASDGGFFFNPATGQCDYPQNICPPCGYKWWGCDRTYQIE